MMITFFSALLYKIFRKPILLMIRENRSNMISHLFLLSLLFMVLYSNDFLESGGQGIFFLSVIWVLILVFTYRVFHMLKMK